MGWQGIFKLYFVLFLLVADPEILPHIGKIALCDNTYNGFQPLSPEIVSICTGVCLLVQVENTKET